MCDLCLPESFTHFFMYALITINGQLLILYRQVNQNSVPVYRFFHFQQRKYFSGPVKRIHKPTVTFNVNADLTTCLLFRFTNGSNDLVFFFSRKKIFFYKKWNFQCLVFNLIRTSHQVLYPILVQTGRMVLHENQTCLRKYCLEMF